MLVSLKVANIQYMTMLIDLTVSAKSGTEELV